MKAVLDDNDEPQALKKPFRIFLEKTPVDITYPLVYEKVDISFVTFVAKVVILSILWYRIRPIANTRPER